MLQASVIKKEKGRGEPKVTLPGSFHFWSEISGNLNFVILLIAPRCLHVAIAVVTKEAHLNSFHLLHMLD